MGWPFREWQNVSKLREKIFLELGLVSKASPLCLPQVLPDVRAATLQATSFGFALNR